MFQTSLVFFVLAIIAFIFGATGIAGIPLEYGKALLTVFLLISVITVLAGLILTNGRSS